MKKILSLALCLVLALSVLVGCADDEIGKDIDKYQVKDEKIEDVAIDMYIITGDNTTDNAITTVNLEIETYTDLQYHTKVTVHYLTEAEYIESALLAVNAEDNAEDAANIVLVNSKSFMDTLMATGKLVDLTSYLDSSYLTEDEDGDKDPDWPDYKFGTLNVSITEKLLEASKIDGKLYSIPNERAVGEYEYLVIDEEVVMQTLHYSETELKNLKSLEECADIMAEIETELNLDPADYIYLEKGAYSRKAELEADKKVCNIVTYPIINEEEAFSSAFAIVNRGRLQNIRAMQIIHALHNDVTLRNTLQYGILGTNYLPATEGGTITLVKDGLNDYSMNIEYTGDVFKAVFCEEIGWTKYNSDSATAQKNDPNLQLVIGGANNEDSTEE